MPLPMVMENEFGMLFLMTQTNHIITLQTLKHSNICYNLKSKYVLSDTVLRFLSTFLFSLILFNN